MSRVLRCPGTHSADGETHHNSWTTRHDNTPERRYYCQSCDAFYAHLVDVTETPPKRVVTAGSLGPVIPEHPLPDDD